MLKRATDVITGGIVKVEDGTYYYVLSADGQKGAFKANGVWTRLSDTDMSLVTGNKRKQIVEVYEVVGANPLLDKVSEAMKFVTGARSVKNDIVLVWEFESPEVKQAKADLEKAKCMKSKLNDEISSIERFLNAQRKY